MSDAEFQQKMMKGIEEIADSLGRISETMSRVTDVLTEHRNAIIVLQKRAEWLEGNVGVLQDKAGLRDG